MNNLKTRDITQLALIAALYVAVTIAPVISAFSYGQIQFRVSEILMLLPFFNHKYSWSLIIGCFISNIFSASLGVYDLILGTLATAIACLIITKIPKNVKWLWTVPVVCAVVNGIIVGAELHFVLNLPFWLNFVTVGLGELVVVAIGAIIFYFLMQNQNFNKLIN
ncbi:QueT transporter family protein [Companilactobacillus halodurans]|uniref:QueT transporter family protein n=1 Tax=Companilactobacillus halodurans TaxID=2584183 RepID=A0A5P0ZNN5_9LACO|nr:QueT transporter family protein [Companilactobacillus halodurans]MQS75792.1 QueT transporter family protein [Companilactobacillus halodurans]MQS97996.1 QueT transporter family protein [Companilactobacillus halodurans]